MQEDGDTRSKHLELLFHCLHPADQPTGVTVGQRSGRALQFPRLVVHRDPTVPNTCSLLLRARCRLLTLRQLTGVIVVPAMAPCSGSLGRRAAGKVAPLFARIDLPTNPWKWPLEAADMTAYRVAEPTADSETKLTASMPGRAVVSQFDKLRHYRRAARDGAGPTRRRRLHDTDDMERSGRGEGADRAREVGNWGVFVG